MQEFLQKTICDANIRNRYVSSPTDFTRNRSLSFSHIVILLTNMLKRSLSVELHDYFSHIGSSAVTKSAFSQQRKKLKSVFFQDWNDVLVSSYYKIAQKQVKKWRGFIVLSIDGTKLSLPNTPTLRQTYGYSTNQHKRETATARASILYDVLNKVILKSHLCSIKEAERTTACDLITSLEKGSLLLLDRGYPSFMLFYLIHKQGGHFVMRAQANFSQVVDQFRASSLRDTIVNLPATYKAIKGLEKKQIKISPQTQIKVRLVKVRLDSGEDEILITNLYEKEIYTISDLKKLYFMRWPIETCYGYLKNELQIECFSGINPICIEQDFYANIVVFNLQSIIEKESEGYLQAINRQRKVEYKINKNISWAMLKGRIIDLFIKSDQTGFLLRELISLFEKHLEPVKFGRKFPRTKKSIKILGKYITTTNYKRAI